jgi:hypothetical protein
VNVFVVGTGRCGTSTFYQAARTIVGFTAGHETTAGTVPSWQFADQHIEVAAQLVYGIPRLRATYPDARWVHLVRDREPCVRSLARQCWESMAAFAKQWFLCDHPADVALAAEQFHDLTNELIEALLPPDATMKIRVEELVEAWPRFCEWIGAEYDEEAAAGILHRKYNPGTARGRDNFIEDTLPKTSETPSPPAGTPDTPISNEAATEAVAAEACDHGQGFP